MNADGYHGHRSGSHAVVVSDGIIRDLMKKSQALRDDLESGRVGYWTSKKMPVGREEWEADIVVAEPLYPEGAKIPSAFDWKGAAVVKGAAPDPRRLRLVAEHKSIVTAHRNRPNRRIDLDRFASGSFSAGPNVISAFTLMVGTAERVLNVPDKIRDRYKISKGKYDEERFDAEVRSRLLRHDPALWADYRYAISENAPDDARKTVEYFSNYSIRNALDRSVPGVDALLMIPVAYDNVNAARVDRDNILGINVERAYGEFIDTLANAYTTLWGPRAPTKRKSTGKR